MTTVNVSTLRPGILVSLKTTLKGNVVYIKETITPERKIGKTGTETEWQTTRRVEDVNEFEVAKALRAKARAEIAKVCANTAFGLLCPESDADKLDAAIAASRKAVDDFNRKSKLTKINVYALCGRVSPDDKEAVRAIRSEVRELLDEMKAGINDLDAARVRDAARKVRGIGQMLTPESREKITGAIEAARKTAREIVKATKEVAESGENAATAIDRSAIRTLTEARTAFLEIDADADAKYVAAPKGKGRVVDLAPEGAVVSAQRRRPAKRASAEV
jgi:hypothetical protein